MGTAFPFSVKDTAERVEGQIKAEGWDKGIDGNGSDPLTYTAEGSQPVTEDGKVWQRIEGEHGTCSLIRPRARIAMSLRRK